MTVRGSWCSGSERPEKSKKKGQEVSPQRRRGRREENFSMAGEPPSKKHSALRREEFYPWKRTLLYRPLISASELWLSPKGSVFCLRPYLPSDKNPNLLCALCASAVKTSLHLIYSRRALSEAPSCPQAAMMPAPRDGRMRTKRLRSVSHPQKRRTLSGLGAL